MKKVKPIDPDAIASAAAITHAASGARSRWASLRSSSGYTLVETLVAVMLLALALTVVLQQLSGALNAGRTSEDFTRAIWYAREKMEEIQLQALQAPGIQQGSFDDGYQWETEIERLEPDREPKPREPVAMSIIVRIRWPYGARSKTIALQTLVLAPTNN